MRGTGTYAISTTLGESVQAFVPHPLPPGQPALAPACFVEQTDITHAKAYWADWKRRNS